MEENTTPTPEVPMTHTVRGTTLAECEAQLAEGDRIVHTTGSRVTGNVVCVVETSPAWTDALVDLANRFADDGLNVSEYRRLRRLARIHGYGMADLVAAFQ